MKIILFISNPIISFSNTSTNYIGKLQEYAQSRKLDLPVYNSCVGGGLFAHKCEFKTILENLVSYGEGKIKTSSKQEAAKNMLNMIKVYD